LLCIADDAIFAFQKQAEKDMPFFKTALEMKSAVTNKFLGLKDKADHLLQTRQCEL
jgi:hypothetical protein